MMITNIIGTSQLIKMVKDAKTLHHRKYIKSNKDNPNKLAKLFDELVGKCKENSVTSLIYNTNILTKDRDVANAFNCHFTNITSKYNTNVNASIEPDLSKLQEYVKARIPPNNPFKIPLMTELHVEKFIQDLGAKKATGLNEVDAKFIKLSGPFITKILTQVCNQSISSNTVPALWKIAKVKPLHKKNSKDDPNNYRPISILPVLSKLLETHVSNHLFKYLTNHDLIVTYQSGFRPKHFCETALHLMVDEWASHIFQNEVVGMLYINFCKAFDMVNHNLLLQKLKIYNVHKDAIAWFTSYLSDRKQCIKINKRNMSDQQPVNIGIPHGSILGPLTFLLSVNDLPLQDSLEGLNLFADDATGSAHGPTVENVEKTLQTKAKKCRKVVPGKPYGCKCR